MSAAQLVAALETWNATVTKFCVDCAHYVPRHVDDVDFCDALMTQLNPVNGEELEAVSCVRMRFSGPCGLDAKLYEPSVP